jgi:trimethylamine--corrinoid protein Co-methyltransferase
MMARQMENDTEKVCGSQEADRRSCTGRRQARRTRRSRTVTDMLPSLRRGLPLCAPMDAEKMARIDAASTDSLAEVGVEVRHEIALADWKQARADPRGARGHMCRGLASGDTCANTPGPHR